MFTWADMDEANKKDGHYNHRPEWLARAKNRRDELYKRGIETIDAWEDGLVSWNEVKSVQREIKHAERRYDRLYEFWCASEGNHVHNVAQIPAGVTE